MIATLLPSSSIPQVSVWALFSFDTFVHAFMFSVLIFLMTVGLAKQYTLLKIKHYPIRYALLISSTFGISIEVLQHFFVVGRQGDMYDVLANTIGCLIGIVLFKWVYIW